MINQNMKRRMEMMPPAELKKFATLHKDDPFIVSMALDIDNVRKAAQRQQAMQMQTQQPPVVDQNIAGIGAQVPPQQAAGIPTLPAQNMVGMADGGIAGYAEGGKPEGAENYRAYAMRKAKEYGLDPAFVDKIFKIESGYDPNAKSGTGPRGIGQLTAYIAKRFGITPKERDDPYKNIDASLGFMDYLNKKYKGDQQKIAVAYNQGEPVLDAHLKRNKGQLVPDKLHEDVKTANKQEPLKYLEKLSLGTGTREAPRTPENLAKQEEAIRRRKLAEALPIRAAQAADEQPSKSAPTGSVRDVGMTFPPSMLNPELRKPRSVAGKAAPEDVQYSPEGIPLTTPASAGYPQTKSPVAAQLAGALDIAPKALYGIGRTASENVLALPFGREVPVEKRRETAEKIMSPFYRYGTIGGLTGLARDPAYGTDPATIALEKIVGENLDKSDAAIAAMTGADKENVRLIRENLMLAAPAASRIKPVETGMPKLPSKGKPTAAAAQAAEDAAAAQAAAEAARTKVAPIRLEAPTKETPGVIRQTAEGEGVLPTGEAAAARQRGLAALAEDLNAAKFREAQAARAARTADEAAAAEAQVAGESRLRGRIDKAGLTTAGLGAATAGLKFPPGALEPETTRTPYKGYGLSDAATDAYMTSGMGDYKFGKQPDKFDATTEEKPAAAAEKKGGFTDEDWLMMGLNMLQAPGGQPGGALSQLMSNVGRSGLATLGEKRAREQRELDRMYRQTMEGYYKGLTQQLGKEPEEIRTLRALGDPKLMDRYIQMQEARDITGQRARLTQQYFTAQMMGQIPESMTLDQFLARYGGASGGGTDLFKVVGSRPSQ